MAKPSAQEALTLAERQELYDLRRTAALAIGGDAQIRMECLRLAHNNADLPTIIMSRAQQYLDWVNDERKPAGPDVNASA